MRKARLTSASILAVAAMLAGMPRAVQAQSFDATGVIVAGTGLITTTAGRTRVDADSPNMVINWIPNDILGSGPIDFQPVGTTALFTNRDSTSFAILNRILPNDPARPVVFNGTVVSQLQDLSTGTISRGGTLFFYSPGGILVSRTGVFNVGNLALTASDLAFDVSSGVFNTAGKYKFLPANLGSSVEVRPGAQITAGPVSAYVALIAPKVVNAGTITVDGSAVLVAADASTITFRPDGLFDIQIDQGTSAAGVVATNTGTITGSAGAIDAAHRIYVVAVPKNEAITLAIKGGSKLGFDIAGAADVDGNAIVLSAGYDVTGGIIAPVRSAASGTGSASLAIGAIDATSQVTGQATGKASISIQGGKAGTFASNVNIAGVADPAAATSDGAIVSVSGVGSTLDIQGDLAVASLDAGQVANAAFTDSGNARILVNEGELTVAGAVNLDASRAPLVGVDTLAGSATFATGNGAVVSIGKDLTVSAAGTGKTNSDLSASGPNPGSGGTARLAFAGGSTVTVGGNLEIAAVGVGGGAAADGFAGTAGLGGRAVIEGAVGAGTLTVTGTTLLDARGVGGAGQNCAACTIEGGTGTGGTAGISAAQGARFALGKAITVDASGQGGAATVDNGKAGGAGVGGTAFLDVAGGTIVASGAASVLADGIGGTGALSTFVVSGTPGSGGPGGSGTGGTARLNAGDAVRLGSGGSISVSGDTLVSASGTGADGATGAQGTGGLASVSARNGSITGAALSTRALGLGGAGFNAGNGGAGSGGTARVMAYSALEGDATVTFGTTAITARGSGGDGSSPAYSTGPGSTGGAGVGGNVSALAEAGNGKLDLGAATLNASGTGGNGGDGGAFGGIPTTGESGGTGGAAQGGSARLGVVSGLDTGAVNSGSASVAGADVLARGIGGAGGAPSAADVTAGAFGQGGAASGGAASLVVQGGRVTLSDAAQVDAGALGGATGAGGLSGNAVVGDDGTVAAPLGARLDVASRAGHTDQRGHLTATDLTFTAAADPGKGGSPGVATILGRPLAFLLNGGTIDAGTLTFLATGGAASGAPPSIIALAGGDTTLTGAFSFVTSGTLTAALGGAELFSGTAAISASDWLAGPASMGTPGTIHGTTSVSLLTGGDLFANLSAETGGSLALTSGGLVRLDNLTATGAIAVNAGTTVSLGDLVAGTDVAVNAVGNVTVGAITARGNASLNSGAALTAGGVTSGQTVRINASDSVALGGTIIAGDAIRLVSNGAITGQGLSAGLVGPSALPGATYEITVFGQGPVALGNLEAARDIKLFTPQALTVGALKGREIAVLAGGAQTISRITASGRVLLADYAMTPAGGDPLDTYDLNALFAAAAIGSGGSITVLGTASAGSLTAISVSDVSMRAITTIGAVDLTAGGAMSAKDVTAGGAIAATSAGTMDLASASAGGALTLASGGVLAAGDLGGASGVTVNGLAGVTAGAISASAGRAALTAATDLSAGAVTASGAAVLASTGGSVAAGDVTSSGSSVGMTASGAVSASKVNAASGIAIDAGGNLSLTSALSTAGDMVLDAAGGTLTVGDLAADSGRLLVSASGAATLGSLSAAGLAGGVGLRVAAGTTLALGNASVGAGELRLTSGGTMRAGDLAARAGALNVTSGGTLRAGALAGRDGIGLTSGGTAQLTGDAASSNGDVIIAAAGTLDARAISAGAGIVRIQAATSAATGKLTAASGLTVSSDGALVTGNVTGASVSLTAGTDLRSGAVKATGGAAALTAGGNLTAGAIGATGAVSLASSGGGVTVTGAIGGGGDVTIAAASNVTTGSLTAGGLIDVRGSALSMGTMRAMGITALAETTLGAGAITATAGAVSLGATGNLASGRITATGAVSLASTSGTLTTQAINAGGDLALRAAGDLQTGALIASGNLLAGGADVTLGVSKAARIDISAAGTLTSGKIETTVGDITMAAGGAFTSGSITATGAIRIAGSSSLRAGDVAAGGAVLVSASGDAAIGAVRSQGGTVELRSNGGSLTTGAISTATDTALFAGKDLQVGDVTARDMLLLAGGAVRAASLTSRRGRILVASNALAGAGGAIGDYDFGAVFAAPLQSAGGSLSVTGPVSAADFTAAVAGDASLIGITASRSILVDSGGTVSLGGAWRAPQIEIRASDLVMPAGAGLDAGRAGQISLVSRNAAGLRIGDGLDGSVVPTTAFTLDNAEWGRIRSGSLTVFGLDGAGPVDMLIGSLDVTGPDAGSTIDDPAGTVLFRTGAAPTAAASGTVRVVGALGAKGFRAGNALVFQTGQFQLASDTGTIAVLGKAGALSGTVRIEARDIHIAAASLLTRLAADPFFAGAETALDTKSAGGSGPVLRAGALDLTVGRTFYIQRTGAGTDPLGFEEPLDGFKVGLAGADPITVIINGTFRTTTGLVGGVDAWKLFKASGVNLADFTAESRLNGCLLSAATCSVVPPPRPRPDPGIRTLIEDLEDPAIDDTAPDDPDKREPKSTNAILPPQSILAVQPDALPVQIDEPIAGSGNPALISAGAGGGLLP